MKKKNIKLLLVLLLIYIVTLITVACEPVAPIRIQNRTDQTLSVYIKWNNKEYYIGDVASGSEITNSNSKILYFGSFPIEAKDKQGDVVWAKEYPIDQLKDKMRWIIIIPPIAKK